MADFILPLGGGKFLAKCTPMKCKSADSLAVLGVKYTADLLHVFPLDLPAIRKISQTGSLKMLSSYLIKIMQNS